MTLQRILAVGLVSAGLTSIAEAACKPVPFEEVPSVFVKDFEAAMRRTGTSQWVPAAMTSKGPMFISDGTELRLSVSSSDGLVGQAMLVLGSPKNSADIVRLEAASTHMLSKFYGPVTPSDRAEIANHVAAIGKDYQARPIRRGNAVLVFESPNKEGIVVSGGRVRCD